MQKDHKQVPAETLSNLISNAYDFLGSALINLESDTKRSVIDFHTAVELFLKAPLLHEHWSLIVSKDPQITKFLKGDFVSVAFSESIKRLQDVLEIEITKEAKQAFDKVRQHRNKYVHFFISDGENTTAQIALEQFSAWAYLHNLMKTQLFHIFHSYEEKNQFIESSLKRHKEFWHKYAKLEYKKIEGIFSAKKNNGETIIECPTCAVDSLIITNPEESYTEFHCHICHFFNYEIRIVCPQCKKNSLLGRDGYSYCEHCSYSFSPKDIFNSVNTYQAPRRPGDVDEGLIPANCEYCEGYETVCELNNHYLCSNCLILTPSIGYCEYCSGPTNMYDTSESYAKGCSFCDGAIGNTSW